MKRQPVLLIVDDEKNTREGLARALRGDFEVHTAEDAENALRLLRGRAIDVVISDVRMPGMDGLDLIERVLTMPNAPTCILITAYGNIQTAVEGMKRGAFEILTKPLNLEHLDLTVRRALHTRNMEDENRQLRQQLTDKYGFANLIGQSSSMQHVFEMIRQVAPAQTTVLIQGASGTGKEMVAHAIHQMSARAKGPFIAVHCAALSETLLESELFGHEKGAFTGAGERRRGRFEMADGGTLFLDEVSEVSPAVQVKLLRVLEEREFERVGGQATVEVDIRLIVATNRNLKEQVAKGSFREDLFFRLDVVTIELPPLRERQGDIALLCRHFIQEFNKRNKKNITAIDPAALEILEAYSWPGNVRELRNVMEKMVVLSHGSQLSVGDIPAPIRNASLETKDPRAALETNNPHAALEQPMTLDEAEKIMILKTLKTFDGNRSQAARQLGISRRTLQRKLHEYFGEEPPPDTEPYPEPRP